VFFSGAVIFIIAFFGCCGAWRESPWMIYTYAALLCVILTGRDEYCARIFQQSVGARNGAGIGLPYWPTPLGYIGWQN
jgi:hypothetical protein